MLKQNTYEVGKKYQIDWNKSISFTSLFYFFERGFDWKDFRRAFNLLTTDNKLSEKFELLEIGEGVYTFKIGENFNIKVADPFVIYEDYKSIKINSISDLMYFDRFNSLPYMEKQLKILLTYHDNFPLNQVLDLFGDVKESLPNNYSKQIAYDIMLIEMILDFKIIYNKIFLGVLDFDSTNKSLNELPEMRYQIEHYGKQLEGVIREAHIFIIKNNVSFSTINNLDLFDTEYQNKKILSVGAFNRFLRIWKVTFKDDSWILASDAGNGWYKPLTDFNSYKFI